MTKQIRWLLMVPSGASAMIPIGYGKVRYHVKATSTSVKKPACEELQLSNFHVSGYAAGK